MKILAVFGSRFNWATSLSSRQTHSKVKTSRCGTVDNFKKKKQQQLPVGEKYECTVIEPIISPSVVYFENMAGGNQRKQFFDSDIFRK